MQYFGGKARIGKRLAEAMAPTLAGRYVWEPFMGGLNMTPHLARVSLGVFATDANPALVSLYNAVRAGWDPPSVITRETWQAAKALPDSDPLKGFCGLCSFAGIWFRGYSGDAQRKRRFASSQRTCCVRDAPIPLRVDTVDFCAGEPAAPAYPLALYCDPPYAGTNGVKVYEPSKRSGLPFDHGKFWQRAWQWSRLCPVFVSEYSAPPEWQIVHEEPAAPVTRRSSGASLPERLFYRGPETP